MTNQPPTTKGAGITFPATIVEAHPVDFDLRPFFVDPDGDAVTYRIVIKAAQPDGSWHGLRADGGRVVGVPNRDGISTIVAQTGVTVDLDDGRGGTFHTEFAITIGPNSAPAVVSPNTDRVLIAGATVDYEVTGSGAAFTDRDGDVLAYEISLTPQARGLRVEGTRVRGVLSSMGGVFVHVKASDGFGGSVEDVFAIAAPVPETRKPTLPAVSYVYDDAQLTLPAIVRSSREGFAPLWDTTVHSGNPTTNAGATLGRVLFYDKRLSISNLGSCGTCHHQEHGFAAPERFSAGPQGELTRRNVMGLTAVRYNLDNEYFSDRRVTALEQLVVLPIEEPAELGNAMPLLVAKLAATDFYPPLFEAAFGTREIDAEKIAKALSQFLRSMIAFNTRFDRAYQPLAEGVQPQPEAVLTPQELRGAEIFNGPGHCFFCHAQGAQTMDPETNNALDAQPLDPGSGNGNFRVASLRNVALTAPYMHDGRFATLREVIEHYSSGVLDTATTDLRLRGMLSTNSANLNLSEDDKDALEAFLNTFTDHQFLEDPKFSDPFQ
ncbi:MAG TPA: cytochrome c peroxidase [Steroidobacteraceae bacterium]|nr:cytochrome c peroxidase [Steroidobacteraceae bacterium]